MKKLFEEDDDELQGIDKAGILVKVVPFVLIIIILAITLVVGKLKKEDSPEDLQQSIMDYADENRNGAGPDIAVNAGASNAHTPSPQEPEKENEEEGQPAGEAKTSPREETAQAAKQEENAASASPTPYKEAMKPGKTDFGKVEFHQEEQLKDMMAYWADNNMKAINDLVYLNHYIAMSWSLRGTSNFYYYGDVNANGQPHGKGVAVYADNQYYYGDWADGVRSGNGTWIHFHIHFTPNENDLYTCHQYSGSWAGDLPEGEGSEHYDFDMSLVKGNDGYTANLIGSYAAGLVNGDFYLTNIYADGTSKEWEAKADHGSWIYRNDNKDKKGNRTVHVEIGNDDNYIWMNPKDNVNIGVPCLLSKNKN